MYSQVEPHAKVASEKKSNLMNETKQIMNLKLKNISL